MSKTPTSSTPILGWHRPHMRVIAPQSGELITKQEMKAECDINNILKQFQQTGIYTHVSANASQAVYADLPNSFDYQDALHTVMQAEESFSTLPSVVRDFYQNDPERFLHALTDPAQKDRLTEWGVFEKPVEPPARTPQPPSLGGPTPSGTPVAPEPPGTLPAASTAR